MIQRRVAFAIAIVCGLVAGGIYLAALQRTAVMVAARDLEGGQAISARDLASVALPPDAVPAGALREPGEAEGRHVRAPIAAGQIIVAGSLRDASSPFHTGSRVPLGARAVAIPVSAEHVLGGAVAPGWRVDVVAVPAIGRAPAGRTVEIVALTALVLDVRTESGRPFVPAARDAAFAERIGSIVIAVPPAEELRIADRIATSTFVVLLAPE